MELQEMLQVSSTVKYRGWKDLAMTSHLTDDLEKPVLTV
jgi:hypothetical protein